jgi:membrane protease YdiL (CAAX protease family)
MFTMLSTICAILIKKNGEKFLTMEGTRSSLFTVLNGFVIAVVLVGFTLGQHAVEVILVSNVDIDTAYKLWNFPQLRPNPQNLMTPALALNFVTAIILAPVAEEIFFRRLLIQSLLIKYSTITAVLISSLIFSLLHFHSFHLVSTMVFAITLALLYLKSQSILICIAAHSIFNIFAILNDLYGFRPMVTEQNIRDPATWLQLLIVYAFSATALALLAVRFQRLYGNNRSPHSAECIGHEKADPETGVMH